MIYKWKNALLQLLFKRSVSNDICKSILYPALIPDSYHITSKHIRAGCGHIQIDEYLERFG